MLRPEQGLTRSGFAREDLFTVVHEQFMTDTAKLADIVLPATMFLEHNDYYRRGGHTRVLYGPKIVEAPGECRSNFEVVNELLRRLGAEHVSMQMTDRDMVAETFRRSNLGELDEIEKDRLHRERPGRAPKRPISPEGFAFGRRQPLPLPPDWQGVFDRGQGFISGPAIPVRAARASPTTGTSPSASTPEHPVPPRHQPGPRLPQLELQRNRRQSQKRHPAPIGASSTPPMRRRTRHRRGRTMVTLGNRARRRSRWWPSCSTACSRGVLIAEGIHPNAAHKNGAGINTLIGSDPRKALRRRGVPRCGCARVRPAQAAK